MIKVKCELSIFNEVVVVVIEVINGFTTKYMASNSLSSAEYFISQARIISN